MKLIIFIHGALSSKRSFGYIKGKLEANMKRGTTRAGRVTDPKLNDEWEMRDFSYNITKEPGKDTVERLVKQLSGYLKTFEVEHLVLVGHSFGGVLAVDAVRRLESAVPTSIVSMATPYGGVGLASLLVLFKRSTFLDNVGSYEPFVKEFLKKPLPCRTRKIITTKGSADFLPTANDGVVSLDSQMALANDPNSSFIKVKLNHFEVLLSDEVVDIVIKELNRDPLKPPLKKAA